MRPLRRATLMVLMLGLPSAAWAETWHVAGFLRDPHRGAAPVVLADGSVLVCAGDEGTSCERWRPATNRWLAEGSLIQSRRGYAATLLSDGSALLSGGLAPEGRELASVELREPEGGSWRVVAPMHRARSGHSQLVLPDGRLLVAGGGREDSHIEVWERTTDRWRQIDSPRGFMPKAAAIVGQEVVVAGGLSGAAGIHLQIWKPADGSWREAGRLPSSAYSFRLEPWPAHGALVVHQPRAGAWSVTLLEAPGKTGWTARPWPNVDLYPPKLLAMGAERFFARYVSASWTWSVAHQATQIEQPLAEVYFAAPVVLADGRVLVAGADQDPRLAQYWSPSSQSSERDCTDLQALLNELAPSASERRSDLGAAFLNRWTSSIVRVASPGCRRAVASGQETSLQARLQVLLSRAPESVGGVPVPFVFERSLGRLAVCALRASSFANQAKAWSEHAAPHERIVDREIRRICKATFNG